MLDDLLFVDTLNLMSSEIELEWDEDKRQQTLKERGLDFILARHVLADPNLVCYVDYRENYKETRYIAYGMVQGDILFLCYTMRGKSYRIISLRRTHKKERIKYYGQNSKNDLNRN